MSSFDFVVESSIKITPRIMQLSAMFDCPIQERPRLAWSGELPDVSEEWTIGAIVGPSGSGKTQILNHVYGASKELTWTAASVIDDFDMKYSMTEVAEVCQAVGFNTIPAWMRPYGVLSNGEQFRVEVARRLLSEDEIIVLDEFTSVVDRQVARIGSHAVQKYVRRNKRKCVVASCHYDILDWLQPDWVYHPHSKELARGWLQPRPKFECTISRVHSNEWKLFAPYHYLTADMHVGARCFTLQIDGRSVAFAGCLHRPHPKVDDIMAVSRLVTLPDWQGMGFALALVDVLGAAYKAIGKRLRTYPAHPALVRSFSRSKMWRMEQTPGYHAPIKSKTRKVNLGTRPCAVFQYCGPANEDVLAAQMLIKGDGFKQAK